MLETEGDCLVKKEMKMFEFSNKARGRQYLAIITGALLLLALAVFTSARSAIASINCPIKYTVAAGDTLYKIAQTYKVLPEDIIKLNEMKAPYTLTIGLPICIPKESSATATPTLKAGATASSSTSSSSTSDVNIKLTGYSNYLSVEVSSFPKSHVFYVRAGNGFALSDRVNDWWSIGRLKTDKNGVGKATYRLTTKIQLDRPIIVCLKDTTTDDAYCKYYMTTASTNASSSKASSSFSPTSTP